MNRMRDQWTWNAGYLRAFLLIPTVVGVAGAAAFYPAFGLPSLWFLTALPAGLLLRLIHGAVGRSVERLKAAHRDERGEVVESLMVIGRMQSPGVAVLRSDELALVPIVGEKRTIPLAELEILQEGCMLPGKCLWGKRAFILKPRDDKRLAFAVAEPIGERWSRRFARTGNDSDTERNRP